MFKRIVLLGLLAIIPIWLMAAAPTNVGRTVTLTGTLPVTAATDTMTVDSGWDGAWELVDSVILIKDDSCYTSYLFTARVTLQPGQKLFYGFKDGGTGTAVFDTNICELPLRAREPKTFTISAQYQDSLLSQTDANDTIKVYVAVAGSTKQERVLLSRCRITSAVTNKD